jgi:hypothetical protein
MSHEACHIKSVYHHLPEAKMKKTLHCYINVSPPFGLTFTCRHPIHGKTYRKCAGDGHGFAERLGKLELAAHSMMVYMVTALGVGMTSTVENSGGEEGDEGEFEGFVHCEEFRE